MKTFAIRQPESRWSQTFTKAFYGKNLATWMTMVFSMLTVLLSLPFMKWVHVVNSEALYKSFKLKPKAIALLREEYSFFDILSFVQNAKQGKIGLVTVLLLGVMIVMLYFHILFLWRLIKKKKDTKGALSVYSAGKTAMIFSMILTVGTIWYIGFANKIFKMTGLTLSPYVYLILFLSCMGTLLIQIVQSKERAEVGDHGFFYELRKNWVLFAMLLPAFVYFLINNYLPMVGVYFAFTSFNFRDGLWGSPFIGLKNFEHLFKADLFRLTKNTILYNLVFIGVGNILQVAFAIFVSQIGRKWFKKLSQTMMFMPYFVSYVILKVLVYNLFEYQSGMINTFLVSGGTERIDFYNTPQYWPYLITLFYLWKSIGYGMVVYLATITGINEEYYEAAKIDGANIFQQIRYITLPLIKPTFIILLLYALGSIMKGQFELFYQIIGNNGVLFNATDIFDTFVYRITTTQPLNIGIGTAAGLYQSVFGFVVILVTNFFVKKKSPENALF